MLVMKARNTSKKIQPVSLRFEQELLEWIDSQAEKYSKDQKRYISRQRMITAFLKSIKIPENKNFIVEIE